MVNRCRGVVTLLALIVGIVVASPAAGQGTLVPPFDVHYTVNDLGAIPGVLPSYGGLTFKFDDPNTLLIGGSANTAGGKLYRVTVLRNSSNQIIGFSGSATVFADAPNNDGGVAYGPGNVLFLARYPLNQVGQVKPGSTTSDKVINLAPGAHTPGGLNFVPAGFPGAGEFKTVSYTSGAWFTIGLAPDAAGTYDITTQTHETTIPGGPEGFIYVPPGSPEFTPFDSLLVTEYGAGKISTFELDANGDPEPATRREFLTGLGGAEGAATDPLTGDFLFSTFGGSSHVIVVRGFAPPEPDLVESAVSNPPAVVVLKQKFSVTDSAHNQGSSAGATTTRYYLSLDVFKGATDKLMTGKRVIPPLGGGATSSGTVSVTVATSTKVGVYYLLACADDLKVVPEADEGNNCRASSTTVDVRAPDLAETAVTDPPATAVRGTSFSVTDTVGNTGNAAAGASTTRYALSLDTEKAGTDPLLAGTRAIPVLAVGASSTGSVTVTIPSTIPPAAYYLLACGDDLKKVPESNEKNNCKASATKITVTP